MGRRRKKKDDDGAAKRMRLSIPVPDDRPNWPDSERHEVMMPVTLYKRNMPENFEQEFVAVICPLAKRRTVVACDGWTCSYNKMLSLDRKFQSSLPGGNIQDTTPRSSGGDMCILDCLHYKAGRTFFILDLMMWKKSPYCDSKTEVRFDWISKMENETDLFTVKPENEYHFKSMPRVRCTQEDLYNALAETKLKVRGILFYHLSCTYTPGKPYPPNTPGVTPGVLWLPPENIEKVLGWKPPHNILSSIEEQPYAAAFASASASAST